MMKKEIELALLALLMLVPLTSLATSEVVFTNDQVTVTVLADSESQVAQIRIQDGTNAVSVIESARIKVATFAPDRQELRLDASTTNRVFRLTATRDTAVLIDGVVTNTLGCDWRR